MQGAIDATQSQEESKALTEETAKQLKEKVEAYLLTKKGINDDYTRIANVAIAILESGHFLPPMKHRMIFAIYSSLSPELGIAEALKLQALVENDTALTTKTDKALRADMRQLSKALTKINVLVWVATILGKFSETQFMPIGQSLGKKTGLELLHFVTLLAQVFATEQGPVREAFKGVIHKYNKIYSDMDRPSAENSKASSVAVTPVRKKSTESAVEEAKDEQQEQKIVQVQPQDEESSASIVFGLYNKLLEELIFSKNKEVLTRCEMGIRYFDNALSKLSGHGAMSDEKARSNAIKAYNPEKPTVKSFRASVNARMEGLKHSLVALLPVIPAAKENTEQKSLIDRLRQFSEDLKTLKSELSAYIAATTFSRMKGNSRAYLMACEACVSELSNTVSEALEDNSKNQTEIARQVKLFKGVNPDKTPESPQLEEIQIEQVDSPLGLTPDPEHSVLERDQSARGSLYPTIKESKTAVAMYARTSESLTPHALLYVGAVLMAPLPEKPLSGFQEFVMTVSRAKSPLAQFALVEKASRFSADVDRMMEAHCKGFVKAVVAQENLERKGAGQELVNQVIIPAGGELSGLERCIKQAETALKFWETKNPEASYTVLLQHERFTAKLHALSLIKRNCYLAHESRLATMLGGLTPFPKVASEHPLSAAVLRYNAGDHVLDPSADSLMSVDEFRAHLLGKQPANVKALIQEFKVVIKAAAKQTKLSDSDLGVLMKVAGADEKTLKTVATEKALYKLIDKGFKKMFECKRKLGMFLTAHTVASKAARLAGAIHESLSRGENPTFGVPEGDFSTESFVIIQKVAVLEARNGLTV